MGQGLLGGLIGRVLIHVKDTVGNTIPLGATPGADGTASINFSPTGYLGLNYQKVTTLNSDITLGAAGAVGDAIDSIFIKIVSAASTVEIKDGSTVIYSWTSLAVGSYGPYGFGTVSNTGAWKVNINNASATGSYVTVGGVFTEA